MSNFQDNAATSTINNDIALTDTKYVAARLIRIMVSAVNRHKIGYSTLRYVHRETIRRTKLSIPRRPKKLYDLVTSEELDRFFEVASKDPQLGLLMRLMLSTGARVSEVSSILTSNISFETKSILITGKGNKQRLLILSDRLADAIRLFLHQKRNRWLFENRLGRPYSVRMIEMYFKRFKTAAKIEKTFTPHHMRHYLFSKLSENPNGLDVSVRCLMAGHESERTHKIYQNIGFEGQLPQIREALHNLEQKNILK